MGKKLRFLMIAAAAVLFSTNAAAQDSVDTTAPAASEVKSETAKPARVSADGSYKFKPSWGIGLQYGLTFTDMANFNDYLLKPSRMSYFDANFVAAHELYGEWTPVEGFRLSIFAGYQSVYTKDPGFNYVYGGLEPAFSVRRSFYEFAVGLGVGYGYDWLTDDLDGHGILVRPFVEARFYLADIFALYLRVAFTYFEDFGMDVSDYAKERDLMDGQKDINTDKLSYAGPNVAIGFRFGDYASPVVVVPDTDNDGVKDDIDDCVDVAGTEAFYGCPNPDVDGDGYCDAWVSEKGLSETFAHVCKGVDKCAEIAGEAAFDGCPNPDTDGDGVCDAWVSENGLSDAYANVCKGSDQCPAEAEDLDGHLDDDGCADSDNDGDGLCDPWVSEKGLSEKYSSICKDVDLCPDYKASAEFRGCTNPDPDGDGYCDAWVYERGLQDQFQCKGKDACPNEKGDDDKGCVMKRVVITEDKVQINEAVLFTLNKATIQKASDSLLAEVAQTIKDNPRIKKIEVQGHTDLSGDAKKNQKLSEQRAKAVYDRLIKLGVEKERLTYKGYGSTQPLVPLQPGQKKETPEAAATNRRVVFQILEQDTVQKVVTIPNDAPAPAATAPATAKPVVAAPVTNDKAAADAKVAKDKAEADVKAKADKAAADAKAAKDKAEADVKAKADKAAADAKVAKDKAEADAKAKADKAAADAKAAKDKAEADVKAKADKAAADAKAAKDKAEADAKAKADKAAADAKAKADKAAADAKAAAEAKAKADKAKADKAAADAKAAKDKAEAEAKAKAEKAAADAKAKADKAKADNDAALKAAAAAAAAAAAGK